MILNIVHTLLSYTCFLHSLISMAWHGMAIESSQSRIRPDMPVFSTVLTFRSPFPACIDCRRAFRSCGPGALCAEEVIAAVDSSGGGGGGRPAVGGGAVGVSQVWTPRTIITYEVVSQAYYWVEREEALNQSAQMTRSLEVSLRGGSAGIPAGKVGGGGGGGGTALGIAGIT